MSRKKSFIEKEKIVGLSFKSEEYEINKKTIDLFELLENRRILRHAHMVSIKRLILSGTNFDSPIIINQIRNKKRVIDGQHRITAIKEVLQSFPKFKIKILLVSYSNLTKKQEQEIFARYNKGMRQSSDDFVQMYVDDIPIFEMLKDAEIEVTIYRKPQKFHFKPLLEGYLCSQKKSRWGLSKEDFIDKVVKLGKEDAKRLKEFIKGFSREIYPVGNSDLMKTTQIASILYTFFNNSMKEKDYWKRLREEVINHDKFLIYTRLGGHTATELAIGTINDIFNEKIKVE